MCGIYVWKWVSSGEESETKDCVLYKVLAACGREKAVGTDAEVWTHSLSGFGSTSIFRNSFSN